MVRQIIVPESTDVHISIPQQYVGKKIEILAFDINDGEIGFHPGQQSLDEIYDAIRIDFKHYKFDRDDANKR